MKPWVIASLLPANHFDLFFQCEINGWILQVLPSVPIVIETFRSFFPSMPPPIWELPQGFYHPLQYVASPPKR